LHNTCRNAPKCQKSQQNPRTLSGGPCCCQLATCCVSCNVTVLYLQLFEHRNYDDTRYDSLILLTLSALTISCLASCVLGLTCVLTVNKHKRVACDDVSGCAQVLLSMITVGPLAPSRRCIHNVTADENDSCILNTVTDIHASDHLLALMTHNAYANRTYEDYR
jgi:hypothetical protein